MTDKKKYKDHHVRIPLATDKIVKTLQKKYGFKSYSETLNFIIVDWKVAKDKEK